MPKKSPTLLIVLDGWGLAKDSPTNAVSCATTPTWDRLCKEFPMTKLEACGEAVGLPEKTMGNSEVGHMNIGAGRIVYQDLTRINRAIRDQSFFENPVLLDLAKSLKKNGGCLHLMGLLSDGGVHSHLNHLFALLDFAKAKLSNDVFVHCFMDGRDTPPHAGKNYLQKLSEKLRSIPHAKIATVIGRYYAMDRDKRWERTAKAVNALIKGEGQKATDPLAALEKSYQQNVTDEFVEPIVIPAKAGIQTIKDGDSILFFNFRADRARQLTQKLHEPPLQLASYVTMTRYEKTYPYPVLFPPQNLNQVLGEVVAEKKLRQFRIAETEKYAHVTYFLNGGREVEFLGEDRALVPSPRDVATYDLKPEMSAREVTEELLKRLRQQVYDLLIVNFANPDMVGHSGVLSAAIKAVETVDECLGKVLAEVAKQGGVAVVTADHGNAEQMTDENGNPHTSHTLNLVPLFVVGPLGKKVRLHGGGKLCDITPTLLQLMGIKQPKEMTGASLISFSPPMSRL